MPSLLQLDSITLVDGRGLALNRAEVAAIQVLGDSSGTTAVVTLRCGVQLQCTVTDLQRSGLVVWTRPPFTDTKAFDPGKLTVLPCT